MGEPVVGREAFGVKGISPVPVKPSRTADMVGCRFCGLFFRLCRSICGQAKLMHFGRPKHVVVPLLLAPGFPFRFTFFLGENGFVHSYKIVKAQIVGDVFPKPLSLYFNTRQIDGI